ncbi:MAG: DUF2141 domain-containing protein [Burkholderiales bacterium]|nr:MAG: DUF2141 domain-containing protein [Betaproteobacteria bacterium]TAG78895.1 MAG: DUF2141 domain-containing protein [Burkholderiales bacterium]
MKKYVIAVAALATIALLAFDTQAQNVSAPVSGGEASCPSLNVTGLKPNEGTLLVAVYASADTFFKKPVWTTSQKVSAASMQIPVCNLNADEIAVTAFQDMNGNEKLDSNPLGIPTEPIGMSGKPAMFGPPSWESSKVAFKAASAPIAVKF